MIYAHLATPARRATLARFLGDDTPVSPAPPTRTPVVARRADARVGPHEALGNRIRLVRERLGLGQSALAAKLGVGRTTLLRASRASDCSGASRSWAG